MTAADEGELSRRAEAIAGMLHATDSDQRAELLELVAVKLGKRGQSYTGRLMRLAATMYRNSK